MTAEAEYRRKLAATRAADAMRERFIADTAAKMRNDK